MKDRVQDVISSIAIPHSEWGSFLSRFNSRHHGWLVRLETYDRETRERVTSHELPLKSIELDLEDEKHPRINVSVFLDNKVIKHILYQPSELVLLSFDHQGEQALHVQSVNTETILRFRAHAAGD